jgi:O-antigen/teichoic acid export membrane protein
MILNLLKKIFDSEKQDAIKWSLIGQLSSRGINILSTIVLARLMNTNSYGQYMYIIGSLMFFTNLVGLSIRTTSTRNVAYLFSRDKVEFQKYVVSTLILGNILGFVGFFILFLFAKRYGSSDILNNLDHFTIILCCITVWAEILFGFCLGILAGLKLFPILNKLTILSVLSKFISSIIGYVLYGLSASILFWTLSSVVFSIITLFYLKKNIIQYFVDGVNYSYAQLKPQIKLFLKITVPISLEALFLMTTIWTIQTIIIQEPNIGKKNIGIFNIAYQWKNIALYLPAILINMLQPFFSSSKNTSSFIGNEILFKDTRKLIFIISIIISFVLFAFSFLLPGLYGSEYSSSSLILQILIISTSLVGLSNLTREYFISKGHVWAVALANFIMGSTVILIFFVLKNYVSYPISFAISLCSGEIIIFLFYKIMLLRLQKK